MNILKIDKEKRNVVVILDSDELVILSNVFYNYESNGGKMTNKLHSLVSEICMARDLSQYGSIDDFSFERISRHREEAKNV